MDTVFTHVTLCNTPMSHEYNDIRTVRRNLKKAYRRLKNRGGWRAVGNEFGISGGMAFRIVKRNYEPPRPDIRAQLGLPSMVEVPACPVCGMVHVKKSCPTERRQSPPARLWDWPKEKLKWALENREEIKLSEE